MAYGPHADAGRDSDSAGQGDPAGVADLPVLANVFMHYGFDAWMVREFPGCPFERYADDIVAHCDSEDQAARCGTRSPPASGHSASSCTEKTEVVFCQDANRPGEEEHTSFDFLGYTFRGRLAKGRRGYFVSFAPAISVKAAKAVGQKVAAWHLNRRSGTDLSGLAEEIDPQVRGWIGYYGVFYRSSCDPSQGVSTSISFDGPCRNSNDCAGKLPGLGPGWTRFDSTSPGSSPTGTFSRPPEAGLWEPYDGRLSRTVLREPGGAIPPGYLQKLVGPAVDEAAVGEVEVALVSHDLHPDNLDAAGRTFALTAPVVLTTGTAAARLGPPSVPLDPWTTWTSPDGNLQVAGVPAQHGAADGELNDEGFINCEVVGFVIEAAGSPTTYISGDNASLEVVREIRERFRQIDCAVLFAGSASVPTKFGGRPLTPERAAAAAEVLGSPHVVVAHQEGWRHFTRGPADTSAAFDAAGISGRLCNAPLGHWCSPTF